MGVGFFYRMSWFEGFIKWELVGFRNFDRVIEIDCMNGCYWIVSLEFLDFGDWIWKDLVLVYGCEIGKLCI